MKSVLEETLHDNNERHAQTDMYCNALYRYAKQETELLLAGGQIKYGFLIVCESCHCFKTAGRIEDARRGGECPKLNKSSANRQMD